MKTKMVMLLIAVSAVVFAGCAGGMPPVAQETGEVQDKQEELSGNDVEETTDEAADSADNTISDKTDDVKTDDHKDGISLADNIKNTMPGEIDEEAKKAFTDALRQFEKDHVLPDGTDVSEDIMDDVYDFSENTFAVYDIDGDGEAELDIRFISTYHAGYREEIYGYDRETGTLYKELGANPYIYYYTGGFLKEMAYSNQGVSGDFWPYTIWKYDPEKKEYKTVASVEAWDGENFPEDMNGDPFPAEYDKNKEGILFYLRECEPPYKPINEEPFTVNQFREWLIKTMCIEDTDNGLEYRAERFYIPMRSFTEENINDYEAGDSMSTVPNEDFFTKFELKDMTFWIPDEYLEKVNVKNTDNGFVFYHTKSMEAFKEQYPDLKEPGGFLFSIEAYTDGDVIYESEHYRYYGSSPAKDGGTDYYHYFAFMPTDFPAGGGWQGVDEYLDMQYQCSYIFENIKNGVILPEVPCLEVSDGDEYDAEETDGSEDTEDSDTASEGSADKVKGELKGKGPGKFKKGAAAGIKEALSAYGKIVSDKKYSFDDEGCTFAVADLNSDGTPELIIDPDGLIVSDNLYFTYSDGKVVELDGSKMDIPQWGSFIISPRSGTFCFYRGGPLYENDEGKTAMPHIYIEYEIRGDRIVSGDVYTAIHYEDEDVWDCKKNDRDLGERFFRNFVSGFTDEVKFLDNTPAGRQKAGLE